MRADSRQYALAAATPVAIAGGVYALVATAGTGNLQMAAPNGTFVNVSPAVIPPTAIALAAAGSISPIYLPAGSVQLASGTGWLIGIG